MKILKSLSVPPKRDGTADHISLLPVPLRGIPREPTMMVAAAAPAKSLSRLSNRKQRGEVCINEMSETLPRPFDRETFRAGELGGFGYNGEANPKPRRRENKRRPQLERSERVDGPKGRGSVLLNQEQGAALLGTVLAVILILLAVGLSMVSSGLFEGFMSQAQGDSRDAFTGAQSGIKDAMLRVARSKAFTNTGYFIPAGCSLNGTTVCTKVVVEKDTASTCSQTISSGQDCLIATGTLGSRTRKIEAILSVDATNGKISQVSWKEL
ncbi:hypothetical protein HYR65_02365 [Candidatus Azambacteria bacterium]|nr:hypothetical protein [Candidatus Azambacteria bacterium]